MAIRLLNRSDSSAVRAPLDEKILYHLSLDRTFSYICPTKESRERFLSQISMPTDDIQEINHRQNIIKDFLRNPGLSDRLISLFYRFLELKASQKKTKKESISLHTTRLSSVSSAKNILQARALVLKRALLFVKSFGELLARCDLQSAGMMEFRNVCSDICQNPDFEELLSHCGRYENFITTGFLDFKFELNEKGRIARYSLIDHRYIHITDPEQEKKGFSLFKKETEQAFPCERLYPPANDFYEKLTVSALSDLSGLLGDIAAQIFARFSPVYEDLLFYDTALRYAAKLQEIGVPWCFPNLNSNRTTQVTKLYDLYLLMTVGIVKDIVPNDFSHGRKNGVIVFGDNGSGKTVYLRSIGTMQILAQAGLPIPCEHAEIGVCSRIAAQFSEAEKECSEESESGRFEEEVRELATMVDTLKEGSLVFLNETFQSTAYNEGAEGLYHLLRYFTDSDIHWILVSHLRQLEKWLLPEDAEILHTTAGYKLIYYKEEEDNENA